ncbi:MAG: FAD-dependent oxidoreductase, partial [Chloroflexaceae bacterium]|nr:FAD-dependent oxidoreductase [Chloroflexaceae bacterium]
MLKNPETWQRVLHHGERVGTLWRFGPELYTVSLTEQDEPNPGPATSRHFTWQASPAAGIGPRLRLSVSLHDAVISTHALITASLTDEGGWPWQTFNAKRALRAALDAGISTIQALLLAEAAPEPLEQLALATTPAAVAVLAGDHDAPPAPRFEAAPLPRKSGLHSMAERLRSRFPLTVGHFEAMGALDHLERVHRLEQGWQHIMADKFDPTCYETVDSLPPAVQTYDLIYAGAGLGMLHAAVMARQGWRVLLFDRGIVGCAHREWNISRRELEALVETGVVTWDDLGDVIMREYRDGFVRFYAGPNDKRTNGKARELWMPEVLNVALDANALLRLMRHKLEEAGGTVLSQRAFRKVRVSERGPVQVEVELEDLTPGTRASIEHYRARLLLDGMGSTSPLALLRHAGRPFAGVCPTVGTVARGFASGSGPLEVDLDIGEILLSVADAQTGEQMMWEGFPGRHDEMTVYLFYYSTIQKQEPRTQNPEPRTGPALPFDRLTNREAEGNREPASQPSVAGLRSPVSGLPKKDYSLLELFEQYFTLLPTYKLPGPDFEHLKPVYGYIPARHSLRRQEAPLLRGVLPVGDSAAQQSPLTFCGFGSHVRNLSRTTGLLSYAMRRELLEPSNLTRVSAFQANVSLNWVFSRFMQPWDSPDNVNMFQNIFLDVLDELGVELATRFFQDRMRWSDYHPMLFGTLRRFPKILPISLRVLGPVGIVHWVSDYLNFSRVALVAGAARRAGQGVERALTAVCDRVAPNLSLRLRASYAEWRAMG